MTDLLSGPAAQALTKSIRALQNYNIQGTQTGRISESPTGVHDSYKHPIETWKTPKLTVALYSFGHSMFKVHAEMSQVSEKTVGWERVILRPAFFTADETVGRLLGCHLLNELDKCRDINNVLKLNVLKLEDVVQAVADGVGSDIRIGDCVLIVRGSLRDKDGIQTGP